MSVAIDDAIPDIELPATGGRPIKLSDFSGSALVLFFYPKATTPACTQEGSDFLGFARRLDDHQFHLRSF